MYICVGNDDSMWRISLKLFLSCFVFVIVWQGTHYWWWLSPLSRLVLRVETLVVVHQNVCLCVCLFVCVRFFFAKVSLVVVFVFHLPPQRTWGERGAAHDGGEGVQTEGQAPPLRTGERVRLHQSLNKPDVFLNPNSYCIDRSIQENNIAELKAENMVRGKKRKKHKEPIFSKQLNTRWASKWRERSSGSRSRSTCGTSRQ